MTPLHCCGAGSAPYSFRPAGGPVPTRGDAIHGHGTGATGVGQTWALRCLRGELLRRGRDLVAVSWSGLPRQPQRVSVVARDHVQMEVEDRLPGLRAAGVDEVHAVGPETFCHARG